MKVNLPFVVDPLTDKPSVSLTNLVISVLFLLVASGLDLAGKVKDTSSAVEYFGISSALYFGRRININGRDFSSESENDNEQK